MDWNCRGQIQALWDFKRVWDIGFWLNPLQKRPSTSRSLDPDPNFLTVLECIKGLGSLPLNNLFFLICVSGMHSITCHGYNPSYHIRVLSFQDNPIHLKNPISVLFFIQNSGLDGSFMPSPAKYWVPPTRIWKQPRLSMRLEVAQHLPKSRLRSHFELWINSVLKVK